METNMKEVFVEIGLSEGKAAETVKNANLSKVLLEFVNQVKEECGGRVEKGQGILLYQLATKIKAQTRPQAFLIVKEIGNGAIRSEVQLTAALEFLLHHTGRQFSHHDFCTASGIGIDITPDQIEQSVKTTVEKYKNDIVRERYAFNTGKLMGEVRKYLKWADGTSLRKEIDLQILNLIGPKTAEELAGKVKTPGEKTGKGKENAKPKSQVQATGQKDRPKGEAEIADDGAETIEELMKKKVHLHKVGENYKTDGYVTTSKTMELITKHLKQTGGKVITRFPPEPNGLLHIGHAKAININFGYAKAHEGHCYLRYDDTNPEKEEEQFFRGIRDAVDWLGYTPYKMTHSSDYFDQLYEWAMSLIKSGLAYVCHQTAEEMRGFNPAPSPYRHRPIKESLRLFEDMKRGKFEEGEATLRMKLTLEEGKTDPVAYRIKYITHHRTGDKWCVYPTYDFTHCLCDSLENITHSLCTKEFQSRRSSYYWLCNAVNTYCPVQWEYGRLNMNYTVISKRKIQKLITEKIVSNWDDPRLFTLSALRRRGVPAEAVNNFVAKMGLTTALVSVDPAMLDASIRDLLNNTAPRVMGVLEPLKVEIANWKDFQWPSHVSAPNFPAEPDRGSRKVPFGPVVYIEQSDFREEAEKGFKRMTPRQSVGLKYVSAVLDLVETKRDKNGNILKLVANCTPLTTENKPKGFVQWLANPIQCEVRLYDRLFRHKNPEDSTEVPAGFVSDCNKDSLKVLSNAMVEEQVGKSKIYDKFQFERIGFFSIDPDSKPPQKAVDSTWVSGAMVVNTFVRPPSIFRMSNLSS